MRLTEFNDCAVQMLLKLGSPLTQQNYLALAYWDDRTLEDLRLNGGGKVRTS
jgi:hypothetical protein